MKRLTWKIGGEAGFGIMVSGLTFSKILSRAGYHIIEINEYPSLVRGGHNVVAVSFSDDPIHAPYKPVNILVALNRQTVDYHIKEMADGGIVIYDGDEYQLDPTALPSGIKLYPVPLKALAKSVGGDMLMRNTVALSASLAVLGIDVSYLKDILTKSFAKKGDDVVKQNVDAAQAGFDHIKNHFPDHVALLPPAQTNEKKMVLTGAEATGLGALAAGMKFFACYPMTPINALLAYISAVQVKTQVVYKQPEDEIAGINMAIGASFAGVRSMVATSGGGFALMIEGVSFAGMIEQPVVVIMGMRPGPATGLPTWTGQADLHFILNAGHGEFARFVFAPGDPQEAYELTIEAFNIADKYQSPAIVLVDKYLFESRFNAPVFDVHSVQIDYGKYMSEEDQVAQKDVARYQLTDDGVSPRPIPGRKGGVFRANSDEHDEHGYSNEESENAIKMITKRNKKLEEAQKYVPEPKVFGDADADITLVGWGTTKGAILEAIKELSKEEHGKYRVNYLHLTHINPFPDEAVLRILQSSKRVIDVEGNHNAQMAQYIRMRTGFNITEKILKFDGRPFYPEDIIEGVKGLK